jgi:hypothetical protein
MKKASEEEIEWIKNNEQEFINQLVIGVILSNKVMSSNPQLEQLRLSGNKEEFSKLFRKLMKIEREKLNQNELWKNELQKKN